MADRVTRRSARAVMHFGRNRVERLTGVEWSGLEDVTCFSFCGSAAYTGCMHAHVSRFLRATLRTSPLFAAERS